MKKILMLLAFAGVASVASAQQTMTVTEYEVIQVQDKYQVITNPFWSNWFFSVGGGAQVLYGNNDHIGKFRDRVAPTFNVSVGKWVTPGFGLRMQYSGLQAKGFTTNETANYVVGGPRADGSHKQRWDYMNLHGDLMINLNALFGGYNPNRVYEIIPYIGAGWAHSYSRPHTNAATFNAGIINRFRLSNAVDLNLELSATGLEGKFDGEHGGRPDYDGILGATLGVTYYFPTRGFQRPTPQIISEIELNQMRDQMNAMAAANMQLQQQLANAQQPVEVEDTEEVVITDPNIAPRTVFFKIGSDRLSPQEEMNLSYLATGSNMIVTFLYMVICAPILEEYIFRKLIVDRTVKYGQGVAVVLSGLMFGLFHGNLNQFAYAFLLGMFLAFLYVKTGELKVTIGLHMCINFMGAVVSVLLLKAIHLEEYQEVIMNGADSQAVMDYMMKYLPGWIGYMIYVLFILAVLVTGIVLFIVYRKKLKLEPGQIAKGRRFKTVIGNPGMICYCVFWIAMIIIQMFPEIVTAITGNL